MAEPRCGNPTAQRGGGLKQGDASAKVPTPRAQLSMGAICQPGARVGNRRWPYAACPPDAWLRPWQGVVLSQYDPRAWAGTIAFPLLPRAAEVLAHVQTCHRQGLLQSEVPVRWAFEEKHVIYWEKAAALRPADEDEHAWAAALAMARAAECATDATKCSSRGSVAHGQPQRHCPQRVRARQHQPRAGA